MMPGRKNATLVAPLSAVARTRLGTLSGTRRTGLGLIVGPDRASRLQAAAWLAAGRGAALDRVDLSRVVSTYIGETEKNLRRLFDAAERAGAVLLFDEADALFGTRTDVKDAHDRFANLEVGYLLARQRAHDGIVLLGVTRMAGIPPKLLRRCAAVVRLRRPSGR